MKDQEASSLSIKAVLWLSVALILLVAHSATDFISLASNTFNATVVVALRMTFGLSFVLVTAILIWTYIKTHSYRNRSDFFSDFRIVVVLLLASVLPFGANGQPESRFSVIVENALFALRVYTTLYTIAFVYRALELQRTSQTQRYTRVILVGTVIAFAISFIASLSQQRDLMVIALLLAVVLAVIMYLAVKRRTWVLLLARSEKKQLLLLVCSGGIVSVWAAISASSSGTALHASLSDSSRGFNIVLCYACLFLAIFCERVFWTILFSLPNSGMVDRRNFEFSSVAYLNRIAAESTDLEKLYSTVTKLAMQATRATAALCIVRADNHSYKLTAFERLNARQIDALNESNVLFNYSSSLLHPQSIEFLAENDTFAFLSRSVESFAQSLIVAPLRNGKDYVGAVIVVHARPFSFESDDLQAIAAFASSTSVALENARLVEDSLEKERYHRELLVGREIQRKLLPQTNFVIEGFDLFAVSSAALEVGGDYYDFFLLADGKACVLIADVSGKGISAAFYMAKLKGVALAHASHSYSALELVEKINATLYGSMERQMYITLTAIHFYGDGTVSLVRAGHTPALVFEAHHTTTIKPKGLGIGLARPEFFTRCISAEDVHLREGSSLILFTDGINEARNSEGDEFGMERLEQAMHCLQAADASSAKKIATLILTEVNSFSNHSLQHDDMTLIVIRKNGNHEIDMKQTEQIRTSTVEA